jgi:hypothetical protein
VKSRPIIAVSRSDIIPHSRSQIDQAIGSQATKGHCLHETRVGKEKGKRRGNRERREKERENREGGEKERENREGGEKEREKRGESGKGTGKLGRREKRTGK